MLVSITVKFFSIARQRAGINGLEFVSSERKLGSVLREILDRYRMADVILNDKGEVRDWARVLINGRSHEFVGGMDADLNDGDRIVLVYPYVENF